MYNVGLLIYGAVQFQQIKQAVFTLAATPPGDIDTSIWHEVRPYLIAIPCILTLGTVLLSIIAWKLYDEFAWTIYKHISADLRMKRRYLTFQIYIALLKFDFFFFLGFTVQFVVIVTEKTNTEFGLTVAAIPVTIVILILAAYFTRRENLPGMIVIIVRSKIHSFHQLCSTTDSMFSEPLLLRTRLFHFQASENVRTEPQRFLHCSSQRVNDVCRSDHHTHPDDDCQRLPVRQQLQERPRTLRHQEEGPKSRRERIYIRHRDDRAK